jgi:hypothetical protein
MKISIKHDKNNVYFTPIPIYMYDYLDEFFIVRETFQINVWKIETHTLRSITFLSENWAIYEIICKIR